MDYEIVKQLNSSKHNIAAYGTNYNRNLFFWMRYINPIARNEPTAQKMLVADWRRQLALRLCPDIP